MSDTYIPDPIERGEAATDRVADQLDTFGGADCADCGEFTHTDDLHPATAHPYCTTLICGGCVDRMIDAAEKKRKST